MAKFSSSVANRNISKTYHWVDLKPVCKLAFICCGLVEKKNRALHQFNHGGWMKFENTFFQLTKFRFSTIFDEKFQLNPISSFNKLKKLKRFCFSGKNKWQCTIVQHI